MGSHPFSAWVTTGWGGYSCVAITGGSKSRPAAPETSAFRSFRTADTRPDATSAQLVLNLVPEKERAVAEIARVLKPDGRVQIGDIIIGEVLPDEALRDIELWTG
jgi:SAM-dependent methyltransferase